jgi:hypothetical protein
MLDVLNNLIDPIVKLLTKDQFQTEVDLYISSKNPSSPAEVDYWMREYDYRKTNNWSGL